MLRRTIQRFAAAPVETGAATGGADPAAAGGGGRRKWFQNHIMTRRRGGYQFHDRWGSGQEDPYSAPPLQMEAKLHCVDNTNCKHIRLVRETCERKAHTRLVPAVVHRVSLIRFKEGESQPAHQKLQPGDLMWAVLLTRRCNVARHSGLVTSFDKSTAILINDKGVPVGTRITYAAGRHINHKYHLKTAVLANFFI